MLFSLVFYSESWENCDLYFKRKSRIMQLKLCWKEQLEGEKIMTDFLILCDTNILLYYKAFL